MGDDSERLHLEGLDQATERERWEEHFAAPTDLPDAETAWREWFPVDEKSPRPGEREAFLAGLDAANAEREALKQEVADRVGDLVTLQRHLDAALARNAELQASRENALGALGDVSANRDALRAELDNLRETLAQKIEAEGKKVVQWLADTRSDATDMGRLIGTEDAYKHAAALVRGSDDE